MTADLDELREEAENLEACLNRLRAGMGDFPDQKQAVWLEGLMESSLLALRTHILDLERLAYRSPHKNIMFVKRR